MVAFTEIQKGLARQVALIDCDWFDVNACPAEKHIALTAGVRPDLTFNHHSAS